MGQSSRPSPSRYSHLVLASLAGLVATILPAQSKADIYQSVGPDGVVSFTNTKSAGAKLYQKTQARPQVFLPADTSPERYTRYDNWIREAATLYQIPEALIRAVIRVESDFDPRAVSPANARGLMQMIPETAERMLVTDVFDPRQNIFGARRVHSSQRLATIAGGGVRLTMTIGNLTQVVSWVLEWGARAKVLEPPELIDRVRTELAGALALYPAEKPAKAEKKTKSR